MIKFIKILIIVFLSQFNVAQAGPNIKARTAILIDYHSGKVLYELQPDHSIHPASMTKIMTTIVVFDLLNKEVISLDDEFEIPEDVRTIVFSH